MIKGIIPDRYTLRQVKEQTEISEELKNNILFLFNNLFFIT